jgi:hypothetical protein
MPDNFAPVSTVGFLPTRQAAAAPHRDDSRRRRARTLQIFARSQKRHDADAGDRFTTRASTSNCSGAIGAGSFYYREVVLRLDGTMKSRGVRREQSFSRPVPRSGAGTDPVGASPARPHPQECGVRHRPKPNLSPGQPGRAHPQSAGIETSVVLYGRKAVISDLQGRIRFRRSWKFCRRVDGLNQN